MPFSDAERENGLRRAWAQYEVDFPEDRCFRICFCHVFTVVYMKIRVGVLGHGRNDSSEYDGAHNKKGQDLHEDIDDGKSVFLVRVSCTEPEIQTSDRRNEPQPFPDADMPSFFFEHEDVDCPEDEIKQATADGNVQGIPETFRQVQIALWTGEDHCDERNQGHESDGQIFGFPFILDLTRHFGCHLRILLSSQCFVDFLAHVFSLFQTGWMLMCSSWRIIRFGEFFFVHEKLTVSSVFGNGSQNFQYSIQDVLQQQKDDGYDW